MTAVCPPRGSIGFSTVGVDHSYGVFEVSNIANCGEAGTELDIPPNTMTRPSEAKKRTSLYNNTSNCNFLTCLML